MTLSWAHIHLLLNHFPIIGAILALIIFIVGLIRKSRPLKQTSYWMFFLMALLSIAVFYSGNQASEMVETLPNVTEAIVHRHKAVAEWALLGLMIIGALSLMGLFIARRDKLAPPWFNTTFLVVAFLSTALVSWAGIHGGSIRHTEVRGELSAIMLEAGAFAHEEGTGHGHSESGSSAQPLNPADETQSTESSTGSAEHGESPSHSHE